MVCSCDTCGHLPRGASAVETPSAKLPLTPCMPVARASILFLSFLPDVMLKAYLFYISPKPNPKNASQVCGFRVWFGWPCKPLGSVAATPTLNPETLALNPQKTKSPQLRTCLQPLTLSETPSFRRVCLLSEAPWRRISMRSSLKTRHVARLPSRRPRTSTDMFKSSYLYLHIRAER